MATREPFDPDDTWSDEGGFEEPTAPGVQVPDLATMES